MTSSIADEGLDQLGLQVVCITPQVHDMLHFVRLNCVLFCATLVIMGACYIGQQDPRTVSVAGTVVDVDRAFNEASGVNESRVTVEYDVDGEGEDKGTKHQCLLHMATVSHIFKGDVLDLVVDPCDPSNAALEPCMSSYTLGWLMLIAGLLMLVLQIV